MSALELVLMMALMAASTIAWMLRRQLRGTRARHASELAEERAQQEAERHAQSDRTAAIFDGMMEGIIVVSPTGKIRLANRAAAKFFGFKLPAINHTVLEATRHHEVAALVGRLEDQPEVLNHELRLDGVAEMRYLQINALALRSAAGVRDGALLVFHDMTRLRQLESVRQEFVANVSHELRTPLSLIKSAAETLIDGGKNDPVVTSRFLEIIEKHSDRLNLLIDDLLLLARLDSGRVELKLEPMPLRDAAQEALDDAALIARARGTELVNDVPSGVLAEVDPDRLRQVLANLIANAIKYGRAQGRVTLSCQPCEGGKRVELTVHDDGPGIPIEAQARIFERFYRADKARVREQGGTGLGLAIVKNVVQAHGGDVRVESTPETGTKFFIRLPAAGSADDRSPRVAAIPG